MASDGKPSVDQLNVQIERLERKIKDLEQEKYDLLNIERLERKVKNLEQEKYELLNRIDYLDRQLSIFTGLFVLLAIWVALGKLF
ncbi:MAG: hypothetical protein H6673_04860 [Anaerolineales bacterium]|nr:hypothetical protein [Anaerolineales bacterium]